MVEMSDHICSRDDCKPASVSGPSAKCGRCGKLGFLFCHGFEKHGNDYVKCDLPNGSKFIASPSSIHWVCQSCHTAGMVITATGPMTSAISSTPKNGNNSSRSTEKMFIALNDIKQMLVKNQGEIVGRLNEIGPAVIEANEETKHVKSILLSERQMRGVQNAKDLAKELFGRKDNGTENTKNPKTYPELNAKQTPKQRTFATVVQSKLAVTPRPTPTTGTPSKRKRDAEIFLVDNRSEKVIEKVKLPTPKQGTKKSQLGKSIAARNFMPKAMNPLTKSIRVAGIEAQTTTEQLDDYIVEYSSLKDKTKFKCTKLVKKDQDISKLRFVSFKIDVSPNDFNELMDVDLWPQHANVREFINLSPPKQTFGQFLPRSVPKSPSEPEQQSKMAKTDQKKSSTSTASSNNSPNATTTTSPKEKSNNGAMNNLIDMSSPGKNLPAVEHMEQ